MAAGQTAASCLRKFLYPGIVFKRPGLVGDDLGRCIYPCGKEKEQYDSGTQGPIDTPVDKWQDKQEKSLFSQKGEGLERDIHGRACLLKP